MNKTTDYTVMTDGRCSTDNSVVTNDNIRANYRTCTYNYADSNLNRRRNHGTGMYSIHPLPLCSITKSLSNLSTR